ncbi:MAG TPA: TIR domain-containing protein [Caulobacteraceae bacterium]|nr:TIR domain-containing protein [Caulobacteraceae bacterium]
MDIFVSYARSTELFARQITDTLSEIGYSVWRDEQLPAHRAYAEVIEERLNQAKAVLVIWSPDAIRSEWVRSEADRARQQRKLVQLSVGSLIPPMPFDQIQCPDFSDWTLGSQTSGWRSILASLGELISGRPPAADPDAMGRPAGAGVSSAEVSNLPRSLGPLIGRQADVTAIVERLETSSLVTIVGSGGVGKTSVGLEVGRRLLGDHEDGVWLVELAGVTDPARVPELAARAMHMVLPVGENAIDALVTRLRSRRCLLILDNCEHLIHSVAEMAVEISSRTEHVRLMLTSQEPLGIPGEQLHRLFPLAEGDAVALFKARARARDAAFAATPGDDGTIAAICRRLDGVPLALEMAAARAPALGCEAVLRRLDDRFRVLTGGGRTAMPRQRSLLAALDWSHQLLSDSDAAVFRRISIFAGSFSLEAASDVAADSDLDAFTVIDALSSLVAKSLLTANTSGGQSRYRLLETARAYGLERLAAAGELETTRLRHALWFADFATPIWPDFIARTSDEDLLSRYLPEFDNIHQALDWAFSVGGDVAVGHRLLAASACLWDDRSLNQRLAVAVPLLDRATPPYVRAKLLAARAHVTMQLSPAAALGLVDEAIAAVRDGVDDPVAVCDALASKCTALYLVGRFAEARVVRDEMKALMSDRPDSRIKAFSIALDGCLMVIESGPGAAAGRFDAAISSLRAFGADGLANFWQATAMSMIPAGDVDQEINDWRTLLDRIRPGDMSAGQVQGVVASALGERLAQRGRPEDIEEALALGRRIFKAGAITTEGAFLLPMAILALKSGRPDDGAVIFGYADHRRRASGAVTTTRSKFEAARDLFAAVLDEPHLTALIARGAMLGRAEVERLALGERPARSRPDATLQKALR